MTVSVDLQTLIEKLDPVCRKGLETAAEHCVSQTNYNVEVEHLLLKLIDVPGTEIRSLLRYYEINIATLTRELTLSIDRFKRGNSRTPALSPYILSLLEQAWLISSLQFKSASIRPGAIFYALLDHDALRGVILESVPCLKKISREAIKKEFSDIIGAVTPGESVAQTVGAGDGQTPAKPSAGAAVPKTTAASRTPSLDQFTIDLTARAAQGQIDPIYGRDPEIRQLIDILTRRRQNNPILTGAAGVGKTAVVEGFALRIARKDVPPGLANISLRLLDLALLQAGAGIRGEFEKRLKAVIDEVKRAPRPIILFIDEAHNMIGAGGAAGQGDAANLLKPALARGELRTIAATTWSEYKKYFEKDPALARRFQVVKVEEPEEDAAVEMLRGIVANLEIHHGVTVLDEAVWDAVQLSQRFISGRQLPDKAISVLDTACARVAVGQTGTPPEIEDAASRSEQLALEIAILEREQTSGRDHSAHIRELAHTLEQVHTSRKALEDRFRNEQELVGRILDLQRTLQKPVPPDTVQTDESSSGENGPSAAIEANRAKLLETEAKLATLQGEAPMVPVWVDSGVVARVISNWTGIPVGKMLTDEIDTVLTLKDRLSQRIIGQPQALDTICRRIQTYRADLDDPGKPVGVFLLVGPSGIGKTETALALADTLYGGDSNIVTINMSEYQESYTVSGLKGSPPGYVGYGSGGVLTEAIRQNPYSVLLLDEVEKAHPDVMEIFYQVFDKGTLEDAEGVVVDFKNTVILLTANTGSEAIWEACRQTSSTPAAAKLAEAIRPHLLKHFKAAFLGRLVVVPYYPLGDDVIRRIVRLKLDRIKARFGENHRIALTYSDALVAAVATRCSEVDTGARNVDHILTHSLLPELSEELLKRMAVGQTCTGIHIDIDATGGFTSVSDPIFRPEDGPGAASHRNEPLDRPLSQETAADVPASSIKELLAAVQKKGVKPPGEPAAKIDKKSKRWKDLLNRL